MLARRRTRSGWLFAALAGIAGLPGAAQSATPREIDLAAGPGAALRLDSTEISDEFGRKAEVCDVNGDGISDLVVSAPGASGINNSRFSTGEVSVIFAQRRAWAGAHPVDALQGGWLFGQDGYDDLGEGLGCGDLNADGFDDLFIGARDADGPSNTDPRMGEVRAYQPAMPWPSAVDLALESDLVVYGEEAEDELGRVRVGDINGDGFDDLCMAALWADGPNNSRNVAGEVYCYHGPLSFPGDSQIGDGRRDLTIYGPGEWSGLTLLALSDLNGDGIREIVAATYVDDHDVHSSVWVISPVDVDGDGFEQLADNCPLVANPDQLDMDGDRRGDACASDWDGDGLDDAADCAPADPAGGRPPAIEGVRVERAASTTTVSWSAEGLADLYDVSRGLLSALDGQDYGACQNHRDPDRTDTVFEDAEVLPAGDGYFYVVRGVDTDCPATGTWGAASDGTERTNANPAGCP
jgi:hypothetical protein